MPYTWKPPQKIRATAQALILRNNQLLVYEGIDTRKNEKFYRPVGGTIEFLELGKDAVVREFKEEAGIEICNLELLGFSENIYVLEEVNGHEIVQFFLAEFKDHSLYQCEFFPLIEGDKSVGNAVWKDISWLTQNNTNFFPNGSKKFASQLLKEK